MILLEFNNGDSEYAMRELINRLRTLNMPEEVQKTCRHFIEGGSLMVLERRDDGSANINCNYLIYGCTDLSRYNFYKEFLKKALEDFHQISLRNYNTEFSQLNKFLCGKYSCMNFLSSTLSSYGKLENQTAKDYEKLKKHLNLSAQFYLITYSFYIDPSYDESSQIQAGLNALDCMAYLDKILNEIYKKYLNFCQYSHYDYDTFANFILRSYKNNVDIFSNFLFLIKDYWINKLNFLSLYYEFHESQDFQECIEEILYPVKLHRTNIIGENTKKYSQVQYVKHD